MAALHQDRKVHSKDVTLRLFKDPQTIHNIHKDHKINNRFSNSSNKYNSSSKPKEVNNLRTYDNRVAATAVEDRREALAVPKAEPSLVELLAMEVALVVPLAIIREVAATATHNRPANLSK